MLRKIPIQLAIALLVAGCSRSQQNASLLEAGPVAPSSSLSSSGSPALSTTIPSAFPERQPTVRLEARRDEKGKGVGVWLIAPELGLQERVSDLKLPFVCRLSPTPSGGEVTCTPTVSQRRVVLERGVGEITLTVLGRGKKALTVPPSAGWTVAAGEVSVRDLPEEACPAEAAPRTDKVEFWAEHHMIEGVALRLIVPQQKRGEPQIVELFRQRAANTFCDAEGTPLERRVRCDSVKNACLARIEGASVSFECEGPPPNKGRVLLPCGSKAEIVTSGRFGCTQIYW